MMHQYHTLNFIVLRFYSGGNTNFLSPFNRRSGRNHLRQYHILTSQPHRLRHIFCTLELTAGWITKPYKVCPATLRQARR